MDSDPTEPSRSTRRPSRTSSTVSDSTDESPYSEVDGGEAATFSVLGVDAPSRAQIGEKIGVVVTVRNDGDRPGTYHDAVVVADGPGSLSADFTATDIAPGETRKVVVGVSIDEFGDTLLGLRDAGTTTRVVVGGIRPPISDSS